MSESDIVAGGDREVLQLRLSIVDILGCHSSQLWRQASAPIILWAHGFAEKAMLRPHDADGADKLGLVETLRAREHVHGAVSDVRVDDSQVSISFRAPGYTADAFIDRDTGKYDLTEVRNGYRCGERPV